MIRILYNQIFDSATISSSSEASTSLIDDNVVDEFVAKKWRSTGDSTEYLLFDLGSSTTIKMVAIFSHNLTSGATITLQGNDTDSWGSPTYDETVDWSAVAIVQFLNETLRYWRIVINDASNPDGYIEIGRVCGGSYYEPAINITDKVRKAINDPSVITESEGRQGYSIVKPKYRTYTISFDLIPLTQQDELETIFRFVGKHKPIVISLDPVSRPNEETIYCKITSDLPISWSTLAQGDVKMSFEEKVT